MTHLQPILNLLAEVLSLKILFCEIFHFSRKLKKLAIFMALIVINDIMHMYFNIHDFPFIPLRKQEGI